jgi:hypothetical protein
VSNKHNKQKKSRAIVNNGFAFKTEIKSLSLSTIQIEELNRLKRKSFLEADDD